MRRNHKSQAQLSLAFSHLIALGFRARPFIPDTESTTSNHNVLASLQVPFYNFGPQLGVTQLPSGQPPAVRPLAIRWVPEPSAFMM